jgi:hypothetical protein
MPVEDFIIYVYCCVVDIYNQIVQEPLRTRGFAPKLTDSEVITMEIVGEFMGKDQDKNLWRYFRNHWHSWFPSLGSRANFAKQSANLYLVKEQILRHLIEKMGASNDNIHIVDGFPMPVCKITRAAQSHCFRGEVGYSYCAAKDEKYYGFEGHVVINYEGVICGYTFAAANIDERDVLQDMTEGLSGFLLGDKGYIRPILKEDLKKQELDLETPLRKNMKDTRPKAFVKELISVRRRVETVIGQLVERFHIERVRVRDMWHLFNRFIRKLLAHTVGVFLNRCIGNDPLQFESLVEI